MGFQDEMKQMFLHVAAGNVEPEEWETWWNGNKARPEEILTRGDRVRMMPALWSANYCWMAKTQSGVACYFHAQGCPVKMRTYAGSCDITTAWPKRRKGTDDSHSFFNLLHTSVCMGFYCPA